MKYRIGDEVMVKAIIAGCTSSERCMIKVDRTELFVNGEDIIPIADMTAEETWEIARRIVGCHEHGLEKTKRREIFRRDDAFDVFNLFNEHEAKAKIEAWEAKKEIKVGDEVAPKSDPNNNKCKFIVTIKDDEDGIISGFSVFGGDIFSERDIELYQKTGRHIDIEGLLKQIGGDE